MPNLGMFRDLPLLVVFVIVVAWFHQDVPYAGVVVTFDGCTWDFCAKDTGFGEREELWLADRIVATVYAQRVRMVSVLLQVVQAEVRGEWVDTGETSDDGIR